MSKDISTLDRILKIKERLEGNLSSHQLFIILDGLYNKAVHPLAESTTILRQLGGELLTYIYVDGRKKVSNIEFQKQSDAYFTMVLGSKEACFEAFKSSKLDRGVVSFFLGKSLENNRSYARYLAALIEFNRLKESSKKTCQAIERIHKIISGLEEVEQRLGGERSTLQAALATSSWYAEKALDFRNMIAEKYYRLSFQKAMRSLSKTKVIVDKEDLYNNYLLALLRSIDKYDSDRGVLTDYLDFWFRNANTNSRFDHQYQVSYSIPGARRRLLKKSDWLNSKGKLEQNLSLPIDEHVENIKVDFEEPEFETNSLLKKLDAISNDDDARMSLLVSNIDYPAEFLDTRLTVKDKAKQKSGDKSA